MSTLVAPPQRGTLYVNSKGFAVRKLSHSQYAQYRESGAKYKWNRLFGWKQRVDTAAQRFGDDLQNSIRFFYEKHEDPSAEFARLWAMRKATDAAPVAELDYGMSSWEEMLAQGQGLMNELVRSRASFPIRKPRFYDWKDKYVPSVLDHSTGVEYTAIPDLIDKSDARPLIADIKALGKPLNCETPGIVGLDGQLRTQAAVMGIYRIALWVFVKTPARPAPVEIVSIAEKLVAEVVFDRLPEAARHSILVYAYRQVNGGTYAEAAAASGFSDDEKARKKAFKDSPDMKEFTDSVCGDIAKTQVPRYRIQYLEAEITKDHAEEAMRDELSVIPQIQAGWFPCRCGVRWPNDGGPRCPYRGLCLEERIPNASPEWKAAWQAITAAELKQDGGEAEEF